MQVGAVIALGSGYEAPDHSRTAVRTVAAGMERSMLDQQAPRDFGHTAQPPRTVTTQTGAISNAPANFVSETGVNARADVVVHYGVGLEMSADVWLEADCLL